MSCGVRNDNQPKFTHIIKGVLYYLLLFCPSRFQTWNKKICHFFNLMNNFLSALGAVLQSELEVYLGNHAIKVCINKGQHKLPK